MTTLSSAIMGRAPQSRFPYRVKLKTSANATEKPRDMLAIFAQRGIFHFPTLSRTRSQANGILGKKANGPFSYEIRLLNYNVGF